MKLPRIALASLALLLLPGAFFLHADAPASMTHDQLRALAKKQQASGNFKDAFESYSKLALNAQNDTNLVGDDMTQGIECLRRLARVPEIDDFREQVIAAHPRHWRLLQAAAESYLAIEHYGFMIAGKFQRGDHRGDGGMVMSSMDRDRVRALQLLSQALPLVAAELEKKSTANFHFTLARVLLVGGYNEGWKLQSLTDLATLPDYEPGYWGWHHRERQGAPVDADGKPIYYAAPKRWEDATSDGERWRWALSQAAEADAARLDETRMMLAQFSQSQFGEQTLAEYGGWFGRAADDDGKQNESGTYALHTLGEDETIAKLAIGIRRFKLPEEYNYIRIYRQIAEASRSTQAQQASASLAAVFENRRQYDKATDAWRQAIKNYGPGNGRQQRLDQIVGNWGRFEPSVTQPAGRGAELSFRFRNGRRVQFTAHVVKVDKLLADVKAYLKDAPRQLDWNKLNVSNIGYRLVEENQQQYVGEQAAAWTLDLTPREKHFDRIATVTTPLQRAGAYLLTAKMDDGNTSRIVVWLADTVIAKKPLAGKSLYYVADAVTGKPIPKANLEFFGYRQRHLRNNQFAIDTTNFADASDADGLSQPAIVKDAGEYQWLVTARGADGRFAYLGFTNVWSGDYYDGEYNETKCFAITDRPVYRPKQAVKFKFWIRQAKYDQDDKATTAGQKFSVEIRNPKGDKVLEQQFTADAYGGFDGTYELPADATLGVYQAIVLNHGSGSFRVEEYKKPEFEVKIEAPKKPIALGEKAPTTIEARYYFGAPVTNAKVKYKVQRSTHDANWYPVGRWDWLYGRGYWWFAYDYAWYPGWGRWGCMRPIAWWWGRSHQPPELVAEAEVEIGPEGKVSFDIDTALAKEMHADSDHEYSITAEVVDESRRTIVGSGKVLVARQPFKVFSWVDRGHYRVGDTVEANFSAHTLDEKPVQGTGQLKLFKITYDADRKPVETEVQAWALDTNAEGLARQQLKASAAGQYRLSYTLTDAASHAIEGAYVFTVIGEGFDGSQFRFASIELVPDKREYQPGEKVQLMINTDRAGAAVLLFVRPANGVYLPPKLLRLEGKSTVTEIDVVKKDMPNFFVEALTVADGRLHNETKEIVVPPERRVVNIAVEPSAEKYKPGEKSEIKLSLTGTDGKPFVGSTVVAIYDKSVEYISGGSNVPDIREFFWKWRRHHYPHTESSLDRYLYNLVKSGQVAMGDLGVFGGELFDDAVRDKSNGLGKAQSRRGELRESFGALGGAMPAAAAAPAPAAKNGADALSIEVAEPTGAAPVEPTMRTNFADTALWIAALDTDGDGTARVKLDMPENLTTWKVKVWAMGAGTRVGDGSTEIITSKNLLVRLQAPRFFVEKDEVVLSANVHNYLESKKQVTVQLQVNRAVLVPLGDESTPDKDGFVTVSRQIEIPAGGEQRVDWRVKVASEGEAIVRMKALTDEESDAVEMKFPAYVHGMLKTESFAGALRPEQESGKLTFRIPAERRPEQTRVEVRYSPSLAAAMVDALPYLAEYPYGCTEQTLNRFLPTVITQKVLLGMQLDLAAIRDKRTNLNAQEIGEDRERAKGWKRFDRNPVFDQAELDAMVKEGLRALTDMQVSDGGWGWFSGYGERSYPHTTATVVHGLQVARGNDVAIVPEVLERGVAWLKNYQAEQVIRLKNAPTKKEPYKTQADNLDALVYMVLVDAGVTSDDMLGFLDRDRVQLSVYAKAMFGLALHKQGRQDKLAIVLENIGQYVMQDDENQTAYLKLPEDNYWWHWYGSQNEAMAYYLKLLSKTDPQGETASRLVKYLLNNRKHATYWNSTRDTALCIEALADYLKASGQDQPDLTLELWLDGKKHKEVRITPQDLFTFENKLVLEGAAVESGEHTLEFRKQGRGPLYYNAYVTNFTLEDPLTAAGLEVKVNRKFYKLVRSDKTAEVSGARGQVVKQKVEKYERQELVNLATLTSGDLVEVELEIDSKNDYEYLMFEDMKAAGFEPVDVRSGYGNAMGAYIELRDNRVCFFVRSLARGKHSVSYRLRAEIPGRFSALPTRGEAMYAPELKANSDELKLRIEDEKKE